MGGWWSNPRAASRGDTPTVLYAPAWRGHGAETMLQSLHHGGRIVAALLERGARVVFRPHPFSYAFPEDAATIERVQQEVKKLTDAFPVYA